jgi:hypothetical protein
MASSQGKFSAPPVGQGGIRAPAAQTAHQELDLPDDGGEGEVWKDELTIAQSSPWPCERVARGCAGWRHDPPRSVATAGRRRLLERRGIAAELGRRNWREIASAMCGMWGRRAPW